MVSIQVSVSIKNEWLDWEYPVVTCEQAAGICSDLNRWFQNHRTEGVGRDQWGPSGPTPANARSASSHQRTGTMLP